MTQTTAQQPGLGPMGARITVGVIVLVTAFGIFGWARGIMAGGPDVPVLLLDAGPESRFAIGEVVVFPEQNLYLIGVENGRIRAVDGIARSGCAVRWLPDDPRGAAKNPRQVPGAYEDPCSGGVWAASGDVLEGTEQPMRTFVVQSKTQPDGSRRVQVEVLGNRQPPPR